MDSNSSLEDIVTRCLTVGISCISISDHGTIAGALKMQEIAPFKVIVSEEILTSSGEIIGMFLKEEVPSTTRFPLEEAIAHVRAQGGLLYLPHPLDRIRHAALNPFHPEDLLNQIDIIEVYNARSLRASDAKKTKILAEKFDLPCAAGSDAHLISEIGNAYVEMPEFNGKEDLCQALRQGKIFGRKGGIWVHLATTLIKIRKRF